ncbi:MAG: competence protein ComEC [Halioglobus sp.]|jgi:competence protein ComEC
MKYVDENSRILNWPEMPLARVIILMILGIYSSHFLSIPLLYQLAVCLFFFTIIWVIQISKSSALSVIRSNSLLILFLVFCIGFFRHSLQKTSNDRYHYTNHLNQQNYIVGQIVQEVKKKKASSSTLLAVESTNGVSCRGKLLVYFNKVDSILDYSLGDVISIVGRPNDIQSGKNPKSFDYQKFMENKGVDKQVFLKPSSHSLVREDRIFMPLHFAHQARNRALGVLNKRLPDRDQYATASAMVLGNRDHISDELQSAFSDTGAVHVLAVSGLHVGIVIMLFNFLFRRTRSESKQSKKVIKFSVLTMVVIAYALITGASPAVVRASIMFATLLFGRLWFDNTNIYNILSFSAILILLHDPNNLTDLGFIFSYLALISIVFFQPYFMTLVERFYDPTHWISIRITQLITVSLAAQILIFPLSIYYFHKFPIYFILSGVMAVAMAPFILGCGLLLIFTSFIPIWSCANTIAFSLLLKAFLGIIYGIQMLPFNSIDNVWISKSSMLCLYVTILSIMHLIATRKSEYQRFVNPKKTGRNSAVLLAFISIWGLLGNSIYHTYRIKNHKELIVYDYNGGTLIDIYEGEKLITISSEGLDNNNVKYSCRDNRIYHGSLTPIPISVNSKSTNNSFITNHKGLVHYGDKKILFLGSIDIEDEFPLQSDVLLISNNCETPPYGILGVHKTKQVIIDGSVTYKMINQWKKECAQKCIPFYQTKQDGAYILKGN